jgi:hypothetical protein
MFWYPPTCYRVGWESITVGVEGTDADVSRLTKYLRSGSSRPKFELSVHTAYYVCMYIQGSSVEIQTPAHRNQIGRRMTTPHRRMRYRPAVFFHHWAHIPSLENSTPLFQFFKCCLELPNLKLLMSGNVCLCMKELDRIGWSCISPCGCILHLTDIVEWDYSPVEMWWHTVTDGREVKGKLANGVGSQYPLHYLAHGISNITTADAHTSAASSRLNWRPRRFK